jgi:hypothetical protein
MQLILAIHADRRQADQLAALVTKRLAVELVQATSAGEALQALAERVPDLILTSPLLSPFDEGVLAEYLREIGPAGAHVQTLRIPVLDVAKPTARSLFSFGRKRRTDSTPDGCDPKFFVDEIAVYLARAVEERQAVEESLSTASSVSAEPESPDVTPTYVPAYEPEPYTSHEVTGDRAEHEWRDETPIYLPAVPATQDDEIVDEEPEPVAAYDGTACFEPEPGVDSEPVDIEREIETDVGRSVTDSAVETLAADRQGVLTDIEPEPVGEQQEAVVFVDDPEPAIAVSVGAKDDVGSLPDAGIVSDERTVGEEPAEASAGQDSVAVSHETVAIAQPAVVEREAREAIVTPAVVASDPVPIASIQQPEAERVVATQAGASPPPRRTASFEAALAAIRNAWGNKRQAAPAPTSILFGAKRSPEEPSIPAHSPEPTARKTEELVEPTTEEPEPSAQSSGARSESNQIETRGPLEVDLTGDLDALEEPVLVEAVAPDAVASVAMEDEDVYELSASPALHDLESDLAAASPPSVAPAVLPEVEPEETPQVEARRHATRKNSKKSKKRSKKPQPAKPPKPNMRPAQDEWGLFDPNRCGFAAVVQKLNEVTDEEDQKGNRTTVRVISFR